MERSVSIGFGPEIGLNSNFRLTTTKGSILEVYLLASFRRALQGDGFLQNLTACPLRKEPLWPILLLPVRPWPRSEPAAIAPTRPPEEMATVIPFTTKSCLPFHAWNRKWFCRSWNS